VLSLKGMHNWICGAEGFVVLFCFVCCVVAGLWFCGGFVGVWWWWCGGVVLVLGTMEIHFFCSGSFCRFVGSLLWRCCCLVVL